MKLYKKNNEIKTQRQIVIRKDGMATYNPTDEMILADGWIEYITPELTEVELLEQAIKHKIKEIERFDKSPEVEEFKINGINLWIDRSERETLDRRFKLELKMGKNETILWKNGVAFPLIIEDAIMMLDTLEMYAIATYDNTQKHIANVKALQTLKEVNEYNFKTGYPEKLKF